MGSNDLPIQMMEEIQSVDTAPIGQASLVLVKDNLDKIDRVKVGLAALKAKYANVVYAVTTAEGMAEAKAARAEIREPRYAVDKAAKAAKDPLNALKRDIDANAQGITDELLKLEVPIHEQIKAEEDRVAAEREAKKKAKAEAEAKVQKILDGLRDVAIKAVGMSAAEIDKARTELDAQELTPDDLGERTGEAQQLKMRSLETLDLLHTSAVAREAADAQAAVERAELERMRAEQVERERAEREAREAAARKEQAERDEANRLAAAKLAADRAAFEQEQAAARAALKAESDALAAKQAEQAERERAEQQRQADLAAAERAEQERIEREAAAAEQCRLDEEAAAARAEAGRKAAEQREAEEAAHRADQRGRDAWRVLLAATKALLNNPGSAEARAQAVEAIQIATGEKA